jgi:hypothetical protein
MSQKKPEKNAFSKEAMKKLRESRKAFIMAATTKMKAQKKMIQAIRACLKDGPQTVPSIAEATGAGTAETLWYVAALKKYGEIREAEKDGAYFKYELSNVKAVEGSD